MLWKEFENVSSTRYYQKKIKSSKKCSQSIRLSSFWPIIFQSLIGLNHIANTYFIFWKQIVLQRSPDHESLPGDDIADHLEDFPSKENHRGGPEIEDEIGSEDDHFDKPQAYNGRKREVSVRRAMFVGAIHDMADPGNQSSHFSETEDHLDSRGRTSLHPSKKHNPRNHIERYNLLLQDILCYLSSYQFLVYLLGGLYFIVNWVGI